MRVTQIDHVEIEVPDRYEAARWYRVALGFEICRDYEFWAQVADGPLMISTDDGKTKLALFDGQPQGSVRPVGIRRIRFARLNRRPVSIAAMCPLEPGWIGNWCCTGCIEPRNMSGQHNLSIRCTGLSLVPRDCSGHSMSRREA